MSSIIYLISLFAGENLCPIILSNDISTMHRMKIAENNHKSAKIDFYLNRSCGFNPSYWFSPLTTPITFTLTN